MFLHIWEFWGECERNEEGACLGRRHLSSRKKKETKLHLLFEMEDVFFNIHQRGTFSFSTLVAK